MQRWQKTGLLATVFLTGAAILIIEVVAVRLLSPYFGNTIYTVSSVLSVILAALSFGYAIGGRLADRHPTVPWFYSIIVVGGVSVLLLHLLQRLILPSIGYQLSLVSGPLLVSLLFFLLPCFLLGTLSPYAIRLAHHLVPDEGLGRLSGGIFFWSTLGSILGSLAAGFVLIPRFGLNAIVIGTGVGLGLLGLVPLIARRTSRGLAVRLLVLVTAVATLAGLAASGTAADVQYLHDGVYERVAIRDVVIDGKRTRILQQDATVGGGMLLDSDDLAFNYARFYELAAVIPPQLQRALVLGGGAYTVPRELLRRDGDVVVEVAEIEPDLFALAKKYFRVPDDPRLTNHVTDGRRLLRDAAQPFDFIFSDVYYSLYSIPTHFTTEEFFRVGHDRLTEGGLFLANVIGRVGVTAPSMSGSIAKTFRRVFPHSYLFASDDPASNKRQNLMLVGIRGDEAQDWAALATRADVSPFLRSIKDHLVAWDTFAFDDELLLRDDYAPTEALTARELKKD